MRTPFAIQLFEKCVRGKTPEQLSAETGIPLDRIRARIVAAIQHFKKQSYGASVIRIRNRHALLEVTDSTPDGARAATMAWSIEL